MPNDKTTTPPTFSQARRLLTNRLATMTGGPGFRGDQVRGLLKAWGVPLKRRGSIVQHMLSSGELVRTTLDEPIHVDGRDYHYLYYLPGTQP